MLHTVYVSMIPGVPYLVDDEELLDLQRQGLLAPPPQTVPSPPTVKEVADGAGPQGSGPQVAEADG
jgi:hypothetical protein